MKNLTRYKSQFPLEERREELKISHWQLLHCEAISFGKNGNWQPLSNVLATLWHAARVCLSPLANVRFPLARLKEGMFSSVGAEVSVTWIFLSSSSPGCLTGSRSASSAPVVCFYRRLRVKFKTVITPYNSPAHLSDSRPFPRHFPASTIVKFWFNFAPVGSFGILLTKLICSIFPTI